MKRFIEGIQGIAIIIIAMTLIAGCKSSNASIGSGGTGIANIASAPSEMNVGEVMSFELGTGDTSIDLSGTASDAVFVLVTGTSDIANGSSFEITADGTAQIADASAITTKATVQGDDDVDPSAWLRIAERELSRTVAIAPRGTAGKAIISTKAINQGSRDSFKVLNNLSQPCGAFSVVDSTAAYVGTTLVVFVQDGIAVDEDFRAEMQLIDEQATSVVALLGAPSDVNGDGHVVVNINSSMPTSWTGSALGGYSYGNDPTPYSGCEQASNNREIVHVNYATRASGLMATTIVHEFLHQINYTRRIVITGTAAEQIWLDEALAHLIEEITGNGELNSMWINAFKSNPTSSVVVEGSMTSAQRGAAFLFLKYLYGQVADGETFLHELVNSNLNGVQNVVRAHALATDGQKNFSELMAQWTTSVAKAEAFSGTVNLVALDGPASFSLEPSSAKYFSVDAGSAITVTSPAASSFALLIRVQ